jgi:FtsP/CotA-like multicopper oxidase with cupredoxin domain
MPGPLATASAQGGKAPQRRARDVLRGIAVGLQCAIAAWLPGFAAGGAAANPAVSPGLHQFTSKAGLLDVTLRAEPTRVRIGDLELDGTTYNGDYAGPVLRVRAGDLLRIRLINGLSQPTNLHFHGIRTSPLGNSDNVHLSVAPGAQFIYDVRVPATQPPGLYWYHSHVHGVSEQQVMGGLSGALVVDPPARAPLGVTEPELAERIFVLKDMVFDDDTGNDRIDDELHGIVQSINGALDTTATMRPGETQLWRFSNQSANRAFHIALQGHRFRIVAEDGEAIAGPKDAEILDIMPSSRVEVLVDAAAQGSFALLSKGTMTGTGAARVPDRVLGHLVVAGEPAPRAADPAEDPPPPDLRDATIDARRDVVFTQNRTLKASAQRFFINDKLFDAERVDFRVPLGHVEEWTVRNDSDDMHVFHIHQLGFQVVAINGTKLPFRNRVDTVRVPERGEVTVRMAFTDPLILGRFMFHCHVLRHEDKGMMGQIEIYDPTPPGLQERVRQLYFQVWWWLHGVPWALCGFSHA